MCAVMGRHSHASSDGFTTPQRILTAVLVCAAALTVLGLVLLWPSSEEVHVSPDFERSVPLAHAQVDGTVAVVQDGSCDSPSTGRVFETSPVVPVGGATDCTHAIVELTSGQDAGQRTLLITNGLPGDPHLAEGDQIRLIVDTDQSGANVYSFSDFQRGSSLLLWLALIAVAIIVIGGLRGARAIVGLGITLAVIVVFLLPSLLRGGDPLALALVTGAAVLFTVIYLVHGLNWKSSSALAGTLTALVCAALLGKIAIASTGLRGLGDDHNLLIQLYLPDVSVTGLMLCGFIIGSLGVLNDVTIAQASTVNELYEADASQTPWQLFVSAMRVGRDHIASMVYTLVLTYTGAALPLFLLLSVADRPLLNTLTSDIMATELMRSGVGALALCCAVPMTTAIAALTVPRRRSLTP